MLFDTSDVWAFALVVVIMLASYVWLRRGQIVRRHERERKLRCKELILDKRVLLAKTGVDFDGLVELVKMNISPEQLEKVIGLLTTRPVNYNVDNPEETPELEVDLDFAETKGPAKAPARQKEESPGLADIGVELEKMGPDQEKAWMKMAHAKFRKAVTEKGITERQAKFRLLVKMVELGKKAVEESSDKPVKRKAYELELWDRFYENEYIELNSEG